MANIPTWHGIKLIAGIARAIAEKFCFREQGSIEKITKADS